MTPAAISGSLQVGIGRYKKMSLNNDPVYSVLTVGDQLLWGAAEPLRRMLNILLGKILLRSSGESPRAQAVKTNV